MADPKTMSTRSKAIIAISLVFFYNLLLADSVPGDEKNYFQQALEYDIKVTLDDSLHSIRGEETILYTNNSPDTLTYIYFHLWPNAYTGQQTAFAKQQLENGDTDFYFSKESERGYIDSLAFSVNDKAVVLEYDEDHPDIAELILNTPLAPGEQIKIHTPFYVKIPYSFSRLGHVGNAYQLTQWYPKPAVYDHKGWHQMPYLDQGEFYSEYGSFDVSITLPENYVVGATGDLQNEEERKWLLEKAAKTKKLKASDFDLYDNSFPESAKGMKTLRYVQHNVHDFAWFADKRFHVLHGTLSLKEEERTVDLWAMFTNTEADIWVDAIEYLHDGTDFYSKAVGTYPFNQVTALESALSAGAGMEYPNVTVIGYSGGPRTLERVIVHEVGHNWFYGQLGTNERDHAWMDEGINSYYENRYFREKYKKDSDDLEDFGVDSEVLSLLGLEELNYEVLTYYAYLISARQNDDQPLDLHSTHYTPGNYGSIVYGKGALVMKYLAAYLGQSEFDRVMQKYYQTYEFKHPYPEDLRVLFEEETGKFLDWFFDELIATNNKIDYKITDVKQAAEQIGKRSYDQLKVKNKHGNVRGPYTISTYKDGERTSRRWYDGFGGEMEVLIPSSDYDLLVIDDAGIIPEYNTRNNTYKLKGPGKRNTPIALRPIISIEGRKHKAFPLAPAMGFNAYDGFMLGAAFYNSLIPRRKFEYALVPMYAFKSNSLVGTGRLDYNIYPKSGFIDQLQFTLSGSRFTHGSLKCLVDQPIGIPNILLKESPFHFYKIAPSVSLRLRNKWARSKVDNVISLRHVNIMKDNSECDIADVISTTAAYDQGYYVNELSFKHENKRTINPYNATVRIEQSQDFGKVSAELNYTFSYKRKGKGFHMRLFGGSFLYGDLSLNNQIFSFTMSSPTGENDYLFDQVFMGRLENSGFFGAQMGKGGGGFHVRTDHVGNVVGITDKWIAALNVEADLPYVPIAVYANFGIHPHRELFGLSQDFLLEGGFSIKPIPDRFEIYIPIIASTDIADAINGNKSFLQSITFMLDINSLNPIQLIRDIKF